MNINDFITEYRTDFNIKKHIVNRYIPYEQKMAICKNIIDNADYTPNIDNINKRYYCPNTPMRFVLFCMSIVDKYTDIELDESDLGNNQKGRDVIGGFNKLNSNGVFEELFKELDREYKELSTVLKMMVDDCISKENSIVDFLNTKFDALKALYEASLPIIEDKIVNFPIKEE